MKKSDLPNWVTQTPGQILSEASRFVVGKQDTIENLLVALLAGGHVLLEGAPGTAKTHIAKTFSRIIGCKFTRIQFTPDLLPVDITGSFIFDQKSGEFKIRKGPIFSNIVLIDEINRGTPKTQSGTIEVMQERQVTIEGQTFPLEEPFMVIATRNPLEAEGTYPLVEAQIDRFMLRLFLDYPSREEERKMIDTLRTIEEFEVKTVISAARVQELKEYVDKVYINDDVKDYMTTLIRRTRELKEVKLGGSPRALIHLFKACKARALVEGREYVIPDDAKILLPTILTHRLWLQREAEVEGNTLPNVLKNVLSEVPIPGIPTVSTK